MIAFLVILVILLVVLAGLGGWIYLHIRRTWREQKNYERGLKMVPLLIHLPPLGDDTDSAQRDARDLIDENISKAQVLYNIIASTWQKGFKSTFYGQRHLAFEIVGSRGFINFYVSVPLALLDVVQQAIVSSYPTARLEEVVEHNIFSPVGRINATMGGEFTLKEKFAYPIATYQDLKRDALQSILNSMSTLDKEDGAGIQILLRPANPAWSKTAKGEAAKKRKGNESKKGVSAIGSISKDLFTAFAKPPDSKANGDKPDKKELSTLEQSVVDAIDDKTRYPGFEVLIRVITSSNITQKAQAVLHNIVASFALYDAPGKNGFKYTPAKDIESFVTAYIMRFFPQISNQNILNTIELATLFHFPDQRNIPTSQLERQASKQADAPRNMPETGVLLGYNIFRGAKKPIRINLEDRRRHIYAVGQTGVGKSTFMEDLALQDMLSGNGFAFVDPHGDTVERLLEMVPRERTEDVIYFSPADLEYPLGLNIFEYDNPDQKDFLIQETINMLYKLYDPQRQGIIGPRYEHLFRNAALTVMSDPAGGTFIDIPKLFSDDAYVKSKLKYVTDQTVLDFWLKEMPGAQRSNEFGDVKMWFVSKFGAFLSNQMMRNIIGQPKSSFNLREIMDNKKILLVNLSKGRTGELNSNLLGMIFVMKFQAAAMSRANIPEEERQDFCLYVDEFQNFSTESFATIMSEARKYRLNLVVANQFTSQLSDEVRDAVFGNIGTIISFRIGQNDVEALSKYFQPMFDGEDLLRIPNYNTIVRTLVGGVPTQPFSMATLPSLGTPSKELGDALKQLSAAKYGKPRAEAEAEIFARLKTVEAPRPLNRPGFGSATAGFGPVGAPPNSMGPGGPAGAPVNAVNPKASFLDDWLAKRSRPARTRPVQQFQRPLSSRQQPDTSYLTNTAAAFPPAVNLPKDVNTASIPANPAVSSSNSEEITSRAVADELKQSLTTKSDEAPPNPIPARPAQPLINEPVQPLNLEPEPENSELKVVHNEPQTMIQRPHAQDKDTITIDAEGNLTGS